MRLVFLKFGIIPWAGMFVGGVISALVELALGYPCSAQRTLLFDRDDRYRGNRVAARSQLGICGSGARHPVAAISAFFTAVGCGFYAAFVSYIDPESVMHFRFSLLMALPAVLGGVGSFMRAAVGAVVLIPLAELTRSYLGGAGFDLMICGALVMPATLIRPEGVLGFVQSKVAQKAAS